MLKSLLLNHPRNEGSIKMNWLGKLRPQIFLAILMLAVLAMIAVYQDIPEVATATIGGIIALGMKVLENQDE